MLSICEQRVQHENMGVKLIIDASNKFLYIQWEQKCMEADINVDFLCLFNSLQGRLAMNGEEGYFPPSYVQPMITNVSMLQPHWTSSRII